MYTIRRGETNSSHALDIMNGIIQEYLVPGEELGHGRGLGLKNRDGRNLTTLNQDGGLDDKNRVYIDPFKKLVG